MMQPGHHVIDGLVEDLHVLDRQVAADRIVVECRGLAGGHDVEPGQVAARRTAVADGGPGGGAGGGGGGCWVGGHAHNGSRAAVARRLP